MANVYSNIHLRPEDKFDIGILENTRTPVLNIEASTVFFQSSDQIREMAKYLRKLAKMYDELEEKEKTDVA